MPKDRGYYSEAQRRFAHTATARSEGWPQSSVNKADQEYKRFRSKGGKLAETVGTGQGPSPKPKSRGGTPMATKAHQPKGKQTKKPPIYGK